MPLTLTERDVEVPWAVANAIPPILDVGCAESDYLADLPGPVDGIDVRSMHPFDKPALRNFFHGDIRTAHLPHRYRTVLAVSTIEHVGLAHRAYGTDADDPLCGDRRAVEGCINALRPGGRLLMSVPYGTAEHRGWYRVYDERTLAGLLVGFDWHAEYHRDAAWPVAGVALVTVTT